MSHAMDNFNERSIASAYAQLLKECINTKCLTKGKPIHAHMIKTRYKAANFFGNRLIELYSKCARVMDARHLFDEMPERDIFTWNIMIAGYVKNGIMKNAQELFDKMPERDRVSWNAVIAGYAQHGDEEEALKLFCQMRRESVKPTEFTFGSILRACATLTAVDKGKQIHGHAIKFGYHIDVIAVSALVDMYSKCKRIDDARQVFDKIPQRSLVSWNAMIAGYSQNGCGAETLKLFKQMQQEGIRPDNSTLACVLSACARLTALEHGKQVQGYAFKSGFEENLFVSSALVDIYAKCGSIEDARQVFDKMLVRNIVSWNSMILGCAQNGRGNEAIQLFEEMTRKGSRPDQVTFIGVLTACSHGGLVEEGRCYFNSMFKDHYIVPDVDHYACMVDLLGRAGYLDEAEAFIDNMPYDPDAAMWGALLSACRIHGNVKIGERAANHLIVLEPHNAGNYILLSHMYAEAGCWDDVAKVRKMMKEKGVKKEPGCSWTEVKSRIHTFVSDDVSHPQANEIYNILERLTAQMEVEGYVPLTGVVLQDFEKGQRNRKQMYHSEKLAIAFALNSTSPETTIRIVKNLRVCDDCHTASKFISKIVGREIILRDVSRFHHFKDGMCSCGDYW